MTKEEQQLLLKDLCARLPYEVRANGYPWITAELVYGIDKDLVNLQSSWVKIENCKPYLRPLSSITKKELYIIESKLAQLKDGNWLYECIDEITTLLNSHHLDYRGFIEKGLALEAPANMYKTK